MCVADRDDFVNPFCLHPMAANTFVFLCPCGATVLKLESNAYVATVYKTADKVPPQLSMGMAWSSLTTIEGAWR